VSETAVPVVIPSYNGARQLPNLVPLLALLLARERIPALVHGVTDDPGRITTREVFAALGIAPAISAGEARHQLATVGISFLPVEALAPEVAALLSLRKALGVRNSAHTLVKMLQPFSGAAVRIVSVTHPEYLVRMREYFTTHDTAALLLRGAEGEAVAHPRREPVMEWAFGGAIEVWKDEIAQASVAHALPDRDPKTTARWIESVLAGSAPVPAAIAHQLACCRRAVAAAATAGTGRT
jgi:anthranilate phosphoribosyltransferase